MKITLHIPTEQYGYCEVEPDLTNPEEVRKCYDQYKAAFAAKPENVADDKFVTDYIYNSLNGLGNSPEAWEALHPIQKKVLQCYKNAQNRKKPDYVINNSRK